MKQVSGYEKFGKLFTWAREQHKHSDCKTLAWENGLLYCVTHNDLVELTAKEKFEAGLL